MRERGEARRQRLWKWGPESRLLCALPVRRSVPAKVVTTILRGSYFGERTVAGLETGTRWGRGNLQSIRYLLQKLRGEVGRGEFPASQLYGGVTWLYGSAPAIKRGIKKRQNCNNQRSFGHVVLLWFFFFDRSEVPSPSRRD